jgi:DNA replication factor GINS
MIITSVNSLLPSNNDVDYIANNLISGVDDISILYTFSTLEYLLKDVRVMYLKDIEISIKPLIFISAKEGDMTPIPR